MSLLEDVKEVFADLDELAAQATLTRVTPGQHSAETGTTSSGTTTTASCLAVRDGYSGNLGYLFGHDLVQAGNELAYIPAGLAFGPAPGDTITFGSDTWKIKAAKPIYEGSTPVLWALLVER